MDTLAISRAFDGPRTGDTTFVQSALSCRPAVVPFEALTQTNRRAMGGLGPDLRQTRPATAFGLDSAPAIHVQTFDRGRTT